MRRFSWLTVAFVLASCSGSSTTAQDAPSGATTEVSTTQVVPETGEVDDTAESAPPLLANDDEPVDAGLSTNDVRFCRDMIDLSQGELSAPARLNSAYDRMLMNAPPEIEEDVLEFVRLSRLVSDAAEPYRDDPDALRIALAGLEPAATEMLAELEESGRTGEPGTGPASIALSWVFDNCDLS